VQVIETRGDREGERPLPEIGGKGLFTLELEAALRSGEIDLAVHSLKDLPTELGPGLTVGAVPEREDPSDLWCLRDPAGPPHPREAPAGFRVGTSSLRRQAQCLALGRETTVLHIRGNVGTRLAKLERGDFDAVILAAAGLRRLDVEIRSGFRPLDAPDWLPAPGQGALAVEARAEDGDTLEALRGIEHSIARTETDAERALLAELEGGCQVPLGALARADAGRLELWAFVGAPDGTRVVRAHAEGAASKPDDLGRRVADELRSRGADEILRTLRAAADGD
jgi:hydroxymethylbilane synthase